MCMIAIAAVRAGNISEPPWSLCFTARLQATDHPAPTEARPGLVYRVRRPVNAGSAYPVYRNVDL